MFYTTHWNRTKCTNQTMNNPTKNAPNQNPMHYKYVTKQVFYTGGRHEKRRPIGTPLHIGCVKANYLCYKYVAMRHINYSLFIFTIHFSLHQSTILSPILFRLRSIESTVTSTISPTLTTSNGSVINFLLSLLICTSPSS